MGSIQNSANLVLPVVNKINEGETDIYLYSHKNGLAKYTFYYSPFSSINEDVSNRVVELRVHDKQIEALEDVKSLEVVDVTGRKIGRVEGSVIEVQVSGVYIVNVVALDGGTSTQKVLVR